MSLHIADLTVRYGKVAAVSGVTFTAHAGEILALLGPNGSGKSSLLKAAAALITHDGKVTAGGRSAADATVGYMPQDIGARAALTVVEVVLLGRLGQLGLRLRPGDLDAVRIVLRDLGIEHLAPRYLAELSGGQRQLVYLAQALASDPDLLLLDEPISALDIRHQLEVLDIVRSLTRERMLTTLIVLHDLNAAARFADTIAMMKGGRLMCCASPDLTLTEDMIASVFGVATAIARSIDGRPTITALRSLIERTSP